MNRISTSYGKYNFRKCRIRKKYRYMNFSYEELYSMYGQYDTFVVLEFHLGSESYNKFGEKLMGILKYTIQQRQDLERKLKLKHIPRSSKRTQFFSCVIQELTEEQRISLDRDGILNDDICSVSSRKISRKNAFIQREEKEIANQIKVNTNISEKDINEMEYGLYKERLKNGNTLINFEKDNYYGLKLYFYPESVSDEDRLDMIESITGELKLSIKRKFLETKCLQEGFLSDNEQKEYRLILKLQFDENVKKLKIEIQRSGGKWEDIPSNQQTKLLYIACSFQDEILSLGSKNIWWNVDRFLHIVVRHSFDLQYAKYKDKTSFQYKGLRSVKDLIKAVIESIKEDIKEEFLVNPNKNFNRQGKRAVYYNGNYYKVEIEPSGKLLTFHPYNDDLERDRDNL